LPENEGRGSSLDHHRESAYAHAQLVERLARDWIAPMDKRLTHLEEFEQRVIGASAVIAAMVGGGALVLIGHLLGIKI
jgi:hypothetical protein